MVVYPEASRAECGARWWDRTAGYSVVDLAVALSLVAVLVTAGVAGFRLAHAREHLDGWARSFAFDISTGRQIGMAQRTAVTVTVAQSSYHIATSLGATLRSATLPPDISISTTCPSGACAFDQRGLPTAAGTISLTSASTGRTYMITIEPATGSVWYR